jgi:hypothetical protein
MKLAFFSKFFLITILTLIIANTVFADTGVTELDATSVNQACNSDVVYVSALSSIGQGTACAGTSSGTYRDISQSKNITNPTQSSNLPWKAKCTGNNLSISVKVMKAGGFLETLTYNYKINPSTDLDSNGNFNKNILDIIKQHINVTLPSNLQSAAESYTSGQCYLVRVDDNAVDQSICNASIGNDEATVEGSVVSCQNPNSNNQINNIDNANNVQPSAYSQNVVPRKKYMRNLGLKKQPNSSACAVTSMAMLLKMITGIDRETVDATAFASLSGKQWSDHNTNEYSDQKTFWDNLRQTVNNDGKLVLYHGTGDFNNQHWFVPIYIGTSTAWVYDPNGGVIKEVPLNSAYFKPPYKNPGSGLMYTVITNTSGFWQSHTK